MRLLMRQSVRKLEDLGFAVRGSSPEELDATREQLAKYGRVIKEVGIGNG